MRFSALNSLNRQNGASWDHGQYCYKKQYLIGSRRLILKSTTGDNLEQQLHTVYKHVSYEAHHTGLTEDPYRQRQKCS